MVPRNTREFPRKNAKLEQNPSMVFWQGRTTSTTSHWNSYPPCKPDIQKQALALFGLSIFSLLPLLWNLIQLLKNFKSLLDVVSLCWHNLTCTPINVYSACQVRHKVIFDISFETSVVVTGWKTFHSTVVNFQGRENPLCDKLQTLQLNLL